MPPCPYTFVINIGKGTHGASVIRSHLPATLPPLPFHTHPVFSRMWHDVGCVDLAPRRRAHRVGEGHSRPCTGDIASCASPCNGDLAAVFNSILPEPCAGRAAQRACATMYVTVLSPTLLPMHTLLLFLKKFSLAYPLHTC